jgi:hypothetical protein
MLVSFTQLTGFYLIHPAAPKLKLNAKAADMRTGAGVSYYDNIKLEGFADDTGGEFSMGKEKEEEKKNFRKFIILIAAFIGS